MDRLRKRAYAYVVYRAILDIRMLMWGVTPPRPWQPSWWRAVVRNVSRAEAIADALHNLPMAIASDFEDFDEPWFWQGVERRASAHRKSELSFYRAEFERFIDESAASERSESQDE